MVTFPGCKINLGLHILRRRPDGYHDISTCFMPVPWSDILEVLPSESFAFSLSGLAIPGSVDENLCVKAWQLLSADFRLPGIQGHLHKIVPMGAGLGGGSADAASMLRLVDRTFALNLSAERLAEYALRLGSDCPYFLLEKPAIGQGRGEVLEPIPLSLKGYFLLIVVPPVHISTAEAYAGVTPKTPGEDLQTILKRPLKEWKNKLVNDFESSVFGKFPEVAGIKEKLYGHGAVYASLSGSGSAVYGLFSQEVSFEELFPSGIGWSGWL